MGLMALAECLEKDGFSSRIIHLGAEMIADSDFSLSRYISNHHVRVLGLSLHWHYQAESTLNAIREIKSIDPKIKTLLGGYTASFFAQEIMSDHAAVDYIITGDGELPLSRLLAEVSKEDPDYSSIPNLIWKREGRIIRNESKYTASEADIDQLGFSSFSLFENFPIVSKLPPSVSALTSSALNDYRMFSLCVGRGCPVNCSFCGGGCHAQTLLSYRDKVLFRSTDAVLKTIKDAEKEGIDCLYVSFDPYPRGSYYLELFRKIRESGVRISMIFESWSLPTVEFIKEFKDTFGETEHSAIVLSPESGSERLRKLHKGYFFSNSQLLGCLEHLRENGIATQVWFTYPLPSETEKEVTVTRELMGIIRKRLGNGGQVLMMEFDLDPGSPLYLQPERYGIVKKAEAFSDYCDPAMRIKFQSICGLGRAQLEEAYALFMDSPDLKNSSLDTKISQPEMKKSLEALRSR